MRQDFSEYFEYIKENRRSKCLQCGKCLAGRRPSNLKRHYNLIHNITLTPGLNNDSPTDEDSLSMSDPLLEPQKIEVLHDADSMSSDALKKVPKTDTVRSLSVASSCYSPVRKTIKRRYTKKTAKVPLKALEAIDKRATPSVEKTTEDQFDFAAKSWSITLKTLPREQQLYATRIINEVFFQAQMSNLNADTKLVMSEQK